MSSSSSSSSPVFIGDISPQTQQSILKYSYVVLTQAPFAQSVGSKVVLKEVDVRERDKDGKLRAVVTYETIVEQDMLNYNKTMHGGCAVYLIDVCSSAALATLAMVSGKPIHFVSQALHTTFHAPAPFGAQIEIVNTTQSFGSRVVTTVTEIWDVTHGRLCMTASHSKMKPSAPKL